MNNAHVNITYDFEGDNEDITQYERSLRRLHPADEYPVFDSEDKSMDNQEDRVIFRSREWWTQRLKRLADGMEPELGFIIDSNGDWTFITR